MCLFVGGGDGGNAIWTWLCLGALLLLIAPVIGWDRLKLNYICFFPFLCVSFGRSNVFHALNGEPPTSGAEWLPCRWFASFSNVITVIRIDWIDCLECINVQLICFAVNCWVFFSAWQWPCRVFSLIGHCRSLSIVVFIHWLYSRHFCDGHNHWNV